MILNNLCLNRIIIKKYLSNFYIMYKRQVQIEMIKILLNILNFLWNIEFKNHQSKIL